MDLPYAEDAQRVGPDGRGGWYIVVRPAPGRRTLAMPVATERLMHACALELDPAVRWHLNFDLQFKRGKLRWPRKFGVPLDRVAAQLAAVHPWISG